jgi:hypothetical protein
VVVSNRNSGFTAKTRKDGFLNYVSYGRNFSFKAIWTCTKRYQGDEESSKARATQATINHGEYICRSRSSSRHSGFGQSRSPGKGKPHQVHLGTSHPLKRAMIRLIILGSLAKSVQKALSSRIGAPYSD